MADGRSVRLRRLHRIVYSRNCEGQGGVPIRGDDSDGRRRHRHVRVRNGRRDLRSLLHLCVEHAPTGFSRQLGRHTCSELGCKTWLRSANTFPWSAKSTLVTLLSILAAMGHGRCLSGRPTQAFSAKTEEACELSSPLERWSYRMTTRKKFNFVQKNQQELHHSDTESTGVSVQSVVFRKPFQTAGGAGQAFFRPHDSLSPMGTCMVLLRTVGCFKRRRIPSPPIRRPIPRYVLPGCT